MNKRRAENRSFQLAHNRISAIRAQPVRKEPSLGPAMPISTRTFTHRTRISAHSRINIGICSTFLPRRGLTGPASELSMAPDCAGHFPSVGKLRAWQGPAPPGQLHRHDSPDDVGKIIGNAQRAARIDGHADRPPPQALPPRAWKPVATSCGGPAGRPARNGLKITRRKTSCDDHPLCVGGASLEQSVSERQSHSELFRQFDL